MKSATNFLRGSKYYCLNHDRPLFMPLLCEDGKSGLHFICPKHPHGTTTETELQNVSVAIPENISESLRARILEKRKERNEYIAEQPVCYNSISKCDLENIGFRLSEIHAEDPYADLTNLEFTYRGAQSKIRVRVLEYSDDGKIKIGVLNSTAEGEKSHEQ